MLKKILLTSILGGSILSAADMMAPSSKNPLADLDYTVAFKFDKIYEQYPGTLKKLGLSENTGVLAITQETDYVEIKDNEESADLLKKCQSDCLKHLQQTRKLTLLGPAGQTALMMGLMGGGTAATIELVGGSSFGGSFAVFNTMFSCMFMLPRAINSVLHTCTPPTSPLDEREIVFALNKCFIPHVMWPKIIENFMLARQNCKFQR